MAEDRGGKRQDIDQIGDVFGADSKHMAYVPMKHGSRLAIQLHHLAGQTPWWRQDW